MIQWIALANIKESFEPINGKKLTIYSLLSFYWIIIGEGDHSQGKNSSNCNCILKWKMLLVRINMCLKNLTSKSVYESNNRVICATPKTDMQTFFKQI